MANLTLKPEVSRSVSAAPRFGDFASPSYDIAVGSVGTLLFNIDIPTPDRTDPTKRITAQIQWLNNGVWQDLCGTGWTGNSDPVRNGKDPYPPRCQIDVALMAGKTVRVAGYAGDEVARTPVTINAGMTIQVI